MSTRDISDDLHRSARTTGTTDRIISILQSLQKRSPPIQDDTLLESVIFSPLRDVHPTTFTITQPGGPDDRDVHHDPAGYRRRPPAVLYPHALTYDTANAGGLSYPSDATRRVFGAGAQTDGASHVQISGDAATLKPADAVSFVMWLRVEQMDVHTPSDIIAGFGDGAGSTLGPRIDVTSSHDGDTITFRRAQLNHAGGASVTSDLRIHPDTDWHHLVWVVSPVNRDKLYWDGVLTAYTHGIRMPANAGAIRYQNGNFNVLGSGTPGYYAPSGTDLAWLSYIRGDVSGVAGWIAADRAGLRDFSPPGIHEILTIPFAGTPYPEPAATPAICYPT